MARETACAYLSVSDVCRRYSVNASKVCTWIKAGELRAVDVAARRGGRPRWRISEADLLVFEAGRSPSPPAQAQATPRRRRKDLEIIQYF